MFSAAAISLIQIRRAECLSAIDIAIAPCMSRPCLRAWYATVEQLLLCLPTEATVERVFNHVKHYLGGKCNALLEDYIQAALQLILNDHNNK